MADEPQTPGRPGDTKVELAKRARRIITVRTIGLLILCLALFSLSYNGRADVVHSQREECHAGVAERFADMEAWYAASLARREDAQRRHEITSGPQIGPDVVAAETYLSYVRHAMKRADYGHSLTWPDPEVPGTRGPYEHPLGYGNYSCKKAFPSPSLVQFLH